MDSSPKIEGIDPQYRWFRNNFAEREQAPVRPKDKTDEYLGLQCMEELFSVGAERDMVYRVEAGAIIVSIATTSHFRYDISVALPGDFVGLGFLDEHSTSAFALVPSTVSCIPMVVVSDMAKINGDLQSQLSREVSREFELRRNLMRSGANDLTTQQKVARLLIALNSIASNEGRSLNALFKELECMFLADIIGLSITTISNTINDFVSLGVVRRHAATDTVSLDLLTLRALAIGAAPTSMRQPAEEDPVTL